MIALESVTKKYETRQGTARVLHNVDLRIAPGQKVGILGLNGAGKSTLIRMISGIERPTSGRVRRSMTVSWPLAFSGGFQGSLTGLDNLRFICRVYGMEAADRIPALEEFSELGRYLREPVKTYSAGMRARLAFGISLAVEFDCFLVDEVVAVGDSRFQSKCEDELFRKRADRAFVLASHSRDFIAQHCDCAAVLKAGELTYFSDVGDAYAHYESVLHAPRVDA